MRAFSGLLLAFLVLPAAAETFRLRAPAEALEAVIRADDTLTLEVRYRGKTVARTPALGLEIDGHLRAGSLPRLSGSARRTVNETIRPVVPEKRAVIPDRYNELRLSFGPKLAATFRAYDDGVAYRFETAIDGEVIVRNENAGLRLGDWRHHLDGAGELPHRTRRRLLPIQPRRELSAADGGCRAGRASGLSADHGADRRRLRRLHRIGSA